MIRRSTWIVLIVFAVLAAAAVYMNAKGIKVLASTTPTPTALPSLLDPSRDVIQSIKVVSKQQPVFEAKLGSDGKWAVQQPAKSAVTEGQITEAILALNVAKITGTFDTPLSPKDIGIETPENIVTLSMRDGRTMTIRVGNSTPTGSGYYVQVDSNPAVVVMKASLAPVFTLSAAPPTSTPESTAATPTPAATTSPTPAVNPATITPSPSSP